MNKFLKEKENKFFDERQRYIKEGIIFQLSENVKENEYEFKTRNSDSLEYCECTSSLCYSIEAIFLHGLKDTFLQILTSLGSDEPSKPNPSFWSFVLMFLHKQDIKDILSFKQLSTEIGYSRAFVRKSLNDSLTSSYLQNIRKLSTALKSYYHSYAFLYDSELVETAENLLRGIENFVVFNLPCNSSLLNVWNDFPLQQSGLYTNPMKIQPPTYGEEAFSLISSSSQNIDIPPNRISGVMENIFTADITNSIFNTPSSSTLDLEEDEKLARLFRKIDSPEDELTEELSAELSVDDEATENQDETLPNDNDVKNDNNEEKMQESQDDHTPENAMGNSLLSRNGWTDPNQEDKQQVEEESAQAQPIVYRRSVSTTKSVAIDSHSFESLWNEKHRKSNINFKEIFQRFQKTIGDNSLQQTDSIPEQEDYPEGFVVLPLLSSQTSYVELQQMVEILCRLSTEQGLDAQGFLCKGCRSPLVNISEATVCGFDGLYYCSTCISKDKYAIPARIIFNWDFTQYFVSKKAANFISDYQFKPFIDFKILNPDIYSYIDDMNKLQKLRIQLNFIRAYIFTCSESIIMDMQKILYGKEYIYESIHLYSVSDLYLIQNGSLEEMFKKVVNFGREHCIKCVLCSNKGFICEYCRRAKVIYPFDVDETMRCNICGTVSHINCFNPVHCPKCERKQKRQIVEVLQAENQT